jgi:5-methylcytosine-specific restriction endonuclease McrA
MSNQTPVLLLDAAWRVDRVINVERACELLVLGRAVAASEDVATIMRSQSLTLEVPSVIARTTGRSRTYRPPACSHRRVRLRDGGVCQFVHDGSACGARGDSVDHLLPRSRGGGATWLNLVAACRRCNGVKADRTLEEMSHRCGWGLVRPPTVPSRELILLAGFPRPAEGWLPYLVA